MISKSTAKFIKSLQIKKHRQKQKYFLVEGAKSVLEVINSDFNISMLLITTNFQNNYNINFSGETHIVSTSLLESIGSLKSNDMALAVVEMKERFFSSFSEEKFSLVLDGVNDPGNLGTIIRLADWYGIDTIVASPDTADLYNPKVISSTKGSFTRVTVYYEDIHQLLQSCPLPKFGALMTGENLHKTKFPKAGILVMGNESKGISEDIIKLIDHKITIPRFGAAESLNVAMATGIICDNIARCNS